MVARSTESNSPGAAAIRLNGVTTYNSYANHSLEGDGSAVSSGNYANNNLIELKNVIPGTNDPSQAFGATVIDILDFSSTNKNTTVRGLGGIAGVAKKIYLISGINLSTSAVTSVTIWDEYSSLVANSRFSLYGVK
jgi:hypothetical protein